MSYKVEDTDGNITIMDKDGNDITNVIEEVKSLSVIEPYWELYSNKQFKRFKKVLYQLKETWYDVYETIKFCRIYGEDFTMEKSNEMMKKIYHMFIVAHRHKVEYYNEERLRLRKQKDYIKKKIRKLKNSIQKI